MQLKEVTPGLETRPTMMGLGYVWEDLHEGMQMKTFCRTVTESDLVNFIGVTGMLEAIFIDASYPGAIKGRPVPAALTYCLIEGFILQSMIQGTGLAMLELTQKILAPVMVGDSVHAVVTVAGIRPTSKGNRAVVDSDIAIYNQHGICVMNYQAKRLLAGRSDAHSA